MRKMRQEQIDVPNKPGKDNSGLDHRNSSGSVEK